MLRDEIQQLLESGQRYLAPVRVPIEPEFELIE